MGNEHLLGLAFRKDSADQSQRLRLLPRQLTVLQVQETQFSLFDPQHAARLQGLFPPEKRQFLGWDLIVGMRAIGDEDHLDVSSLGQLANDGPAATQGLVVGMRREHDRRASQVLDAFAASSATS